MKILEFIAMNLPSLLLVIALIVTLTVLYVRGEKKLFYRILFALITEAEARYGSKTGELKKAAVIAKAYAIMPAILKLIITESRLAKWIEDSLTYAKKKWSENADIYNYIKNSPVELDNVFG